MLRRLTLLAVLSGVIAVAAPAQTNLLANGDFAQGFEGWNITQEVTCSPSLNATDVGGFKRALRLVVRPEAGRPAWDIQVRQPVEAFLEQGDRLQLKLWMRSPESCQVSAFVEIAKDPWTKSLNDTVTLTPEWKEYEITGKCLQAYSAGEVHFGMHLGFGPGTIEIAGLRLFDLDLEPESAGERPAPEKPLSLIANGDFSAPLEGVWYGIGGEKLKGAVIEAEVGGQKKAVRLECHPTPGEPPWNLQFGQKCTGLVLKGEALYFRAWLRSPDRCQVSFVYELGEPPHTKSIDQRVKLTPEWQEYRFMGRARQAFRPGQSQAKLFVGYDPGVVEVAHVRVEDCGRAPDSAFDQTVDYWGGREHPDTWRAAALDRIERLRKGDLTIKVLDVAGRPVPGAQVRVEQKRHLFRFGTCAPAERFLDTQNPDNLRFQQEVARLYNTVTFENDLKWAAMGEGRLATVEKAIEWLQAHDIQVRGHCLLWGSYQHIPQPSSDLRGDALRQACQTHVADYAGRMRGKVYLWDVVNEAGSNTEVWDNIGWEAFPDSFRWARAADPSALLCYNDYGIVNENPPYRATVAKRIRYLLDHDAPLDRLGIQGHMNLPLTPIHRVLEILDEWAAFGKDLEITEFDLGCWDDKVHADYVHDFMTAVFSHPRIRAFIMWGFWEGSHWRGKDGGAMFRRDWSKRPAQEAWEDLVFHQWWTQWEGKADAEGAAKLRAFYGRHEVTVEAGGKRATTVLELRPGGEAAVTVRLP